jgi:hypothetical protein
VILFRLGEGVPGEEEDTIAPAPADDETIAGTLHADDVAAAAVAAPDADAVDSTVIHRRAEPPEPLERRPAAARRAGRRRGRGWLRADAGADPDRGRDRRRLPGEPPGLLRRHERRRSGDRVSRVPYDLPLGIHLYQQEYASAMPARAIPRPRRDRVLDHQWRSRGDAVDLVRALERGQLDAGAAN